MPTSSQFQFYQWLLFIALTVVVGSLALGVALSYWILHNIRAFTNEFFDAYPKRTQELLDRLEAANARIVGAYVVRVPFSDWLTFGANLVTSFAYQRQAGAHARQHPQHTALLCEVELLSHGGSGASTKLVLIDKDSRVHVRDDFVVVRGWSCRRVPPEWFRGGGAGAGAPAGCKDNGKDKDGGGRGGGISLSALLNQTRERIGDGRYFNWNLYRNNCNRLTQELVTTLWLHGGGAGGVGAGGAHPSADLRQFIHGRGRRLLRVMGRRDDFMMHVFECLQMLSHMAEKYFMDLTVFGAFF